LDEVPEFAMRLVPRIRDGDISGLRGRQASLDPVQGEKGLIASYVWRIIMAKSFDSILLSTLVQKFQRHLGGAADKQKKKEFGVHAVRNNFSGRADSPSDLMRFDPTGQQTRNSGGFMLACA
jgi:hypothetical protein